MLRSSGVANILTLQMTLKMSQIMMMSQIMAKDHKRAFELAAAGAAMGCAHSKGALGRCLVIGAGVAEDVGKGLALAALGRCV
jgi:hypothetical protein